MVDGLRKDLLAGSGFTREQHRGIRDGDLARQRDRTAEGFRRTDDAVERMLFGEFVLETSQPALHLCLLGGTAQQRQYLVVVVIAAEHPEPPGTIGGLGHLVTFQSDDAGQQLAQLFFVVDNKNLCHSVRSFFSAKVTQ